MKSLPVKVTTPTTIKAINVNVRKVADSQDRLLAGLKRLIEAHENREALAAKAYEDGEPGSTEAIMKPLFEIQEEADFLIQTAEGIKSYLDVLKGQHPNEWGNQ